MNRSFTGIFLIWLSTDTNIFLSQIYSVVYINICGEPFGSCIYNENKGIIIR